MTDTVTDARPDRKRYARGPFRLDEFNLHRYWFSIRNVFFPTQSELSTWRISLATTEAWQIRCDSSVLSIEVTDRIYRDRNDLRATLVLAATIAQPGRDKMHMWLEDLEHIADMAAFIKHTELASQIRSIHQSLLNNPQVISTQENAGVIQCSLSQFESDAYEHAENEPDQLFNDTLAAGSFSKMLTDELRQDLKRRVKTKTVAR